MRLFLSHTRLGCSLVSAVVVLLLSSFVAGCGIKRQTIKTNIQVRVEDPEIRRFTAVTSKGEISATGDFTPGTFLVNDSLVSIRPGTKFRLNLTLPINDPSVIEMNDATGTLVTSHELSYNMMPVPKEIHLNKGVVTGQVSLARNVGAFLLNLIQVGVPGGDMKDMLQHLRIERVVLTMRPNSSLKFGEKTLRVAPGSKIGLSNVVVDQDLNYVGDCRLFLNFAKGCKWIGEKVDCSFDGGNLDAVLMVDKIRDRMQLKVASPAVQQKLKPILFENCTIRFGKNKRCSTVSKNCFIRVNQFNWQHIKGAAHPTMHLKASMDFEKTKLQLKTDISETTGYFPRRVPGVLEVDIKEKVRDTHFNTTSSARAQSGHIMIRKQATSLDMELAETVIGPVSFDREGTMNFSLEGGVAKLEDVVWKTNGSKFVLNCGPGSTLGVPAEMLMEREPSDTTTEMKLPLTLKLGSAVLDGKKGSVKLHNLSGKIMVNVDREIHLDSDMDFGLQDLSLLSGYDAKVKARGLNLSVVDGRSRLAIKHCRITVADEALKQSIRKKVPKNFSIKLNKVLKEDKTWRYRNAIAKEVTVTGLAIHDMKASTKGEMSFTASGDVQLTGTVEKSGLILNRNEWETKPWTLSGRVKGKGKVKYKFLKEKNSSPQEQLHYWLSMEIPIPDNVELDWSQVAGGLLKVAERKAIVGRLKEITVPVKQEDTLRVIDSDSPTWKNLRVSQLAIKDNPAGGTEIDFVAAITMSAK